MEDIPISMRNRPRRQSQANTKVKQVSEDGDFTTLREARKTFVHRKLSDISEVVTTEDVQPVSETQVDVNSIQKTQRPSSAHTNERYEKFRQQIFDVVKKGSPQDLSILLETFVIPLDHPAMLDPSDSQNALHLALNEKRLDIAEFLIQRGSQDLLKQLYTMPKTTRSALHQITEMNNLALAKAFLDRFPTTKEKVEVIQPETMVAIEGQRPRTFSSYHLAAFKGFTDLVRLYLDSGVDIDAINVKKDTALLWAARWGHNDTVEFLLDRNADVSLENDKKSTALYWAVRYQLYDTIVLLLKKGKANPNQTRLLGLVAPIVMASALGNNEIVTVLLDYGADVNIEIRGGETPLHHAAKEGHLDVVHTLLKRNAKMSEEDEKGDTALTLAAQNSHDQVVKLLLHHGADMYHKNHFGFNTWEYAMEQDTDVVLNVLLEHYTNLRVKHKFVKSPLCIAASAGSCDKINTLLKMKVDPEELDEHGNTFLHYAAMSNQAEVIRTFHKKVDIDAKNKTKETAMHIACKLGHHETVLELMDKKAKTNIGNLKGENALHVLAYSSATTPEIAKALIDYMIKTHDWESVNATDKEGNNVLHIAGKFAHPDILWELRFVRFKDTDKDGNTPLHEAVYSGNQEAVETALDIYESMQRDADINIQNNKKESVLHLAASAGFADSVTRLIFYGADLTCADLDGNTVLHRLVKEMAQPRIKLKPKIQVMEAIFRDSVRWWCNCRKTAYPGENTLLFQQTQRKALLSLVNEYQNKDNLSVLAYAYKLGSHTFLNRILTMPEVMMFRRDDKIYFDVTHTTPTTNYNSTRCCGAARVQHANSHVELLITQDAKDRSSRVLDIPPVRQVERMYTSICAWAYAFMITLHVIYMSLFSFLGVTLAAKFRDIANGTPLSDSDPILIATYVIVPIEPTIGMLYVIMDVCRITCRRELPPLRSVLSFVFVITFAGLTAAWLILISVRDTNHDHLLAICLCAGWLLSISFTRGFKGIHYFFKMLVQMIIRDVFRFLIVFSFVLLAFSFAFHAMFQISTDIVNTYSDPLETIFLTFNLMIGMGEIFDDQFEAGMESVGRTSTFTKAIYIVYILLSTIVLLNLLIAMMNDSYSDILRHQIVTWRVESVQIGIGVETMFPWFPSIFGRITINKERIAVGDKDNDEDEEEKWYLITTDDVIEEFSPVLSDHDYAGQLASGFEEKLQQLENRIVNNEKHATETNEKFEDIMKILKRLDKQKQ